MFTQLLYQLLSFKSKSVKFKNTKLTLFLADSLPKQILGLMHRPTILPSEGMLFTFRTNARHSIWMYHMNFSIDCIWIDESGMVIDLVANMKPCKRMLNCPTYYPSENARYVLELKAGESKRLGIKKGTDLGSVIR